MWQRLPLVFAPVLTTSRVLNQCIIIIFGNFAKIAYANCVEPPFGGGKTCSAWAILLLELHSFSSGANYLLLRFMLQQPWERPSALLLQGVTFVNEYALISTLGRGSFGKVKLSLSTIDSQLYALKLMPKQKTMRLSSSRSMRRVQTDESIQQEIDIMKAIDHPNVIRLVEVIGKRNSSQSHCYHSSAITTEFITAQWVQSISATIVKTKCCVSLLKPLQVP